MKKHVHKSQILELFECKQERAYTVSIKKDNTIILVVSFKTINHMI